MKKEDILKAIAIIIIPGAIPVYLGYKAFQFGKKLYDKHKKEREDK